ncbi:hypothetical protein ACPWR0_18510 [Pandoraea pneumonica]
MNAFVVARWAHCRQKIFRGDEAQDFCNFKDLRGAPALAIKNL